MDCLDCLGGAKNVGFYDVDDGLAWTEKWMMMDLRLQIQVLFGG